MATFPDDYTYLGKLSTVPAQISGTLSNFTSVITESSLASGDDISSAVFAATENGGGDVRLSSDEAGANQLPLHVLTWDTTLNTCRIYTKHEVNNTTAVDVHIWGNVTSDTQPAVSATYGRNAVWSEFEYSFDFAIGAKLVDNTGNYSLTEFGTVVDIASPVGRGTRSDSGTNNYYSVNSSFSAVSGSAARTHSFWSNAVSSSGGILSYGTDSTGKKYVVKKYGDGLRTEINGTYAYTSTAYPAGTWHLFTSKTSGAAPFPSCYSCTVDGVSQSLITGGSVNIDTNSAGITQFYNKFSNTGATQEQAGQRLRLFETTVSRDLTEYNNQNSPSTFWTATESSTEGATVSFTIGAPIFASTAQSVAPVITANAGIDISAPIFSASSQSIAPEVNASSAITIDAPAFSVAAQALPAVSGAVVNITIDPPVFAFTAQSIAPIITADSAFTVSAPVFSASAQSLGLNTNASASIEIAKPEFSATAQAIPSINNTDISFTVSAPTFSASAQSVGFNTNSDVEIIIDAPTFSATTQAVGVDITANAAFTIPGPIFSAFAGNATLQYHYAKNTMISIKRSSSTIRVGRSSTTIRI